MWRALVTLLLLTAVVAAAATAAAPVGFRESAPLTTRAKLVSGTQAAVVYCARSDAAWAQFIEATFHDEVPDQVAAVTLIRDRAAFMTHEVCRPLELWVRGRRVDRYVFAVAAYIFTHEAMHQRGIADEGIADCRAVRLFPRVLCNRFGVRNATARRELVSYVRRQRPYLPAEYQSAC